MITKKPVNSKTTAKKQTARKPAAAKKPSAKSSTAKKQTARKPAAKTTAAKKPAAKAAAAKKPALTRPAGQKNGDSSNRFNLIDEPWVPVTDKGPVSLRQIFTDSGIRSLGNSGVSKIALIKFLIAICQAAYTPRDKDDWLALGAAGLAKKTREYLETHYENFFLYGKRPVLQIPAAAAAAWQPLGAVQPDIATGNTTVLTESQQERGLTDAEKAVLVVQLMGFALGGKKTDNSVVFSPGYQEKRTEKGKPSTGNPGSSIGFQGYLHNFLTGANLQETLWLNVLSLEDIEGLGVFTQGLGPIPWETPPKGEDDSTAKALKYSLMGRLVPFSRFVLLGGGGLHYSEGILHPNYKDGMIDPSMAMLASGKKNKVLWADPFKRPWRSLSSLLGFLLAGEGYFDCPYIRIGMNRISTSRILKKLSVVGIWSAGLRVSSKAGEQYVSGADDYVESETLLESACLSENLYINLKKEMNFLEELSSILYRSVLNYHKELKADGGLFARQAQELYWQLCEEKFQDLVKACGKETDIETREFRPQFLYNVRTSYNAFCPQKTARQTDAWAKAYPNMARLAALGEAGQKAP
ncbi:MAG: type I-E CRISPR-associated protein Cse1/CasA [Treponema sp.]|jgi:CRISPR system Cascade subunit CasA|nr:type I-E CRISPR-associated protein Cse1/CasA [Treponema sp.]